MAELKELITKRASIKGRLTTFKRYLDLVEKIPTLSTVQVAELSLKLGRIEPLSCLFDEIQMRIEVLNPETISFETGQRDEVENELVQCIAMAQTILDRYKSPQQVQQTAQSVHSQSCCNHGLQECDVRLPVIQIPKFDGSFNKWLEFRDMYVSLVHSKENLHAISKFQYLRSYLEGEAARVLTNLEMSEANYSQAWKLLCERYDNKRQLIRRHLDSLINIQSTSFESERSLRFLIDHVTKNLRALNSLGQPTDKWDTLIIHIVSQKLDASTSLKWEEHRNSLDDDMPTLEQFHKFLACRADVLESLNRNSKSERRSSVQPQQLNVSHSRPNMQPKKISRSFLGTSQDSATTPPSTATPSCFHCGASHNIFDCSSFAQTDVESRRAEVKRLKLCQNCLRPGHPAFHCRAGPCRDCKKRHNTLLCTNSPPRVIEPKDNIKSQSQSVNDIFVSFSNNNSEILLSTAIVEVVNPITNKSEQVRALLDCGSQSTIISSSLKRRLGLSSLPTNTNLVGIGNTAANIIRERCVTKVCSLQSNFNTTAHCLVLPDLAGNLPKGPIDASQLNIPANIQLADPTFSHPAPVDMLIGADLFWAIVSCERRSLGSNMPILINSQLGWLVSGPIPCSHLSRQGKTLQCNFVQSINNDLNDQLARFWELEELPSAKASYDEKELACEQHFVENTTRMTDGRFCVRLPLNCSPDRLGESYHQARRRLLNLEKRFNKHSEVKEAYTQFMREYADMGHSSETNFPILTPAYFLCHHAVFKDNSESTKVRVVFDGSAKTSTGLSLNDIQMVGPNIQDPLISILLRLRQYRYVLTGDIEKFFRNIEVHKDDRNLQLILWREEESQPIKTYELNTVTYGFASSTFLSTRCLWQLGQDCEDAFIQRIIQHDFYVDDMITGADNMEQLRHIHTGVTEALNAGCLNLRKFRSNCQGLFEEPTVKLDGELSLSKSTDVLGLGWDPLSDNLHFAIRLPAKYAKITKRAILSTSFSIFDPLGLLSPCTVVPKIIMQQLWIANVDWDDAVPDMVKDMWTKFLMHLPDLKSISVPRQATCVSPTIIELHTFSDASQVAYGACVYLKSTDCTGTSTVRLLCAKSKVAPIKPTTIPRLELCGAHLAARLYRLVADSLRCPIDRTIHWCDSQVVLSWLHASSRKLKTFVANRIGEVKELTNVSCWRYVPTAENPADLISRGVDPNLIKECHLWWSGPSFLSHDEVQWPPMVRLKPEVDLPEVKALHAANVPAQSMFDFERYSSLKRLTHVMAYILRFIQNCKNATEKRRDDILSVGELEEAFLRLCKIAQIQSFPTEHKLLSENKGISSKSKLMSLSPFLENGIVRVGGRLLASEYPHDKKHPPILHYKHHLTKLVFIEEHLSKMHAGPQLLLALVRERIWPINGRVAARRTVKGCLICCRFRAQTFQPMMGQLPAQRVSADFPFITVGVDFAGPFMTINKRGRGARATKSYLCIFVCFRYKCLHLEAVSDLTTEGFIACLHRFISRRGKPTEIFCDNGRNFVGADREISRFLRSRDNTISQYAADQGINFRFSPAYGPHFGGIWEAGVRSAKHHLTRVMSNRNFTFEELGTIFAQVEAILNSRPLCPLSSSPHDRPLSPGHFLIGRALTSLPTPALEDSNPSRLQRYARLEQARQHFWIRWQREYICELQSRTKWKTNHATLKLGDVVLMRDENTAPMDWRMGRVTRLFPGPDGISRVADVTTARACYRRPLTRLCPLPSITPE